MIDAQLASALVDASYVQQAEDAKQTSANRVSQLVRSRRLPDNGWSDFAIERLLLEIAAMDSNNHEHNVGAGEREGRVYCELVRRRHWGLAHGIGRSGDVAAIQPKAAGSSLLCRITAGLLRHALQISQVRPPSSKKPSAASRSTQSSAEQSLTSHQSEQSLTSHQSEQSSTSHQSEQSSTSHQSEQSSTSQSPAQSISESTSHQAEQSSTSHRVEQSISESTSHQVEQSISESTSSSDSIIEQPRTKRQSSNKLHVLALPTATGLSLTLAFLALRARLGADKNLVIWPRIDQKSCLKAVLAAGLTPIVVANVFDGDELRTDVAGVRAELERHRGRVLAVFTTTSCFAPRGVDRVVDVAQLCREFDVHHVVNNAYGLQSARIGELLSEAMRRGRLDLIVQSTDKNFLVPVGGAVVVSGDKQLIAEVSRVYPGRASVAPIVDVFATLLSMGAAGYQRLLRERKALFGHLREQLAAVAAKHGERLLATPNNPISMAVTLSGFDALPGGPSHVGAMLYRRSCSGHRVVVPTKTARIDAHAFVGYGAHHDAYPVAYLTAACSIGMRRDEIDVFVARLDRTLTEAKALVVRSLRIARPLAINDDEEKE